MEHSQIHRIIADHVIGVCRGKVNVYSSQQEKVEDKHGTSIQLIPGMYVAVSEIPTIVQSLAQQIHDLNEISRKAT